MNPRESTSPLRFPQGFGAGFSVVLFEPEIPLNVGSIARTCACAGAPMHLVGRLGFHLDNRLARRAGLDYWELAEVHIHRTWEEFSRLMAGRRMRFFSTRGGVAHWDVKYEAGDLLVFGSERTGLPAKILGTGEGEVVAIPMEVGVRSLNLSNAVAIALYEALRQQGLK